MSDQTTRDCDDIAPYLSAYADGELAEPLRSEVAAHIGACDRCSGQLARIATIDQLIGGLARTTPSAGVFERTLAAATRQSVAGARSVTREALGTPRLPELRRRAQRFIAPELEDDEGERVHGPSISARTRRAPWIAAAIPAIAALLLVSFAFALFSRTPTAQRGGAPTARTNAEGTLQQTRTQVDAAARQLAFTPITPTYLPNGASAPTVRVGPDQVDAISRYLDVTWTFTSGPVRTLHLRELPAGLSFYGYTIVSADTAALAWSLPQASGWRQLKLTGCSTCLAVGEAHAKVQLALDAQPTRNASATEVAAWLRLVSLSLDAPYQPLTISLNGPDSSLALQYRALVRTPAGAEYTWQASVVGALGTEESFTAIGAGVNVTEIVNAGSGGARLDNITHTYQPLSPPLPSVMPPQRVTQPLFAPGGFVTYGELWNLGAKQVTLPSGRVLPVYDFYWVDAAQPEHLYVSQVTGRAVALIIDTTASAHPGGVHGAQSYVSTSACAANTVTYTSIEYVPQATLPANAFDTSQPPNWSQGIVIPPFSC